MMNAIKMEVLSTFGVSSSFLFPPKWIWFRDCKLAEIVFSGIRESSISWVLDCTFPLVILELKDV